MKNRPRFACSLKDKALMLKKQQQKKFTSEFTEQSK